LPVVDKATKGMKKLAFVPVAVVATFVAFVAVVAVVAVVAEVAFPLKAAVIVPALKLPEASRATIALAVLAFVAVVAELGMLVRPAPDPVNWVVAVIVVPRTVEAVVAPTEAPSIVPPVIDTELAFCVDIVPRPVMAVLGIVVEAVTALVPLPNT
jgi:hypothetical protein